MLPIKWDRDSCARCGMAISDRRFAAQIRGGDKHTAFKFDDIGCAVTWCTEKLPQHPWMNDPRSRFWVADFGRPGTHWLDARQAHYVPGPNSPMGYNLAAVAAPQAGSQDFAAMSAVVSATWPAACKPGQGGGQSSVAPALSDTRLARRTEGGAQ
jgi:nitrous oxide reductase accessory protein NosL